MLTLRFDHPLTRAARTVGPAPSFRIVGNSLRAGPDDREVGVYADGLWDVEGESFLTWSTQSPVTVSFPDEDDACSSDRGPFVVRVVDGSIRYGPQFQTLLARFDEASQAWHVYPDGKECLTVVLTAP